MKILFTLLIYIFLLLTPSVHAAAKSWTLPLGGHQSVELKPGSQVWIEEKNILKAQAVGNKLTFFALAIGESNITINQQTHKVQVVHPTDWESYSELKKATDKVIGLNAEFTQGQLALTGQLYQLKNWIQISRARLSYHAHFEISSALQNEAQKYFLSLFKKAKLPMLNIIFSAPFEARLNPKSVYKSKYKQLLSPYGINIIDDETTLESAPTIKVQITVAEVRRDFDQKYGIKWPEQFNASLLHTGGSELDDLNLSAQAWEKKGYGKILASPNIICRSGKEAEFLAGGEFPIKIVNFKIQDIIWKNYGVRLKVKPVADTSGRMSISIDTEVSTLDNALTVDGVPGIITNHVTSHFDLLKSRVIALSGLIKNEEGNGHEGLSFLSRIPVLGPLFSSRYFREHQSELVIFVKPTILDEEPDSEQNTLQVESRPEHIHGEQND